MGTVPHGAPLVCPVFIGRAAERAAIDGALGRAREGKGQTVAIAGEPGIGKSRLITESAARAQELGFLGLRGQCLEQDRAVPYAPLLDLLRVLLAGDSADRLVDALQAAPREFLNVLPELSAGPLAQATLPLEPQQQKLRLFHTLTNWLTDLAAERPLLLALEDVHWSDENSLAFLARLARRTAAAPIALLFTYRTADAHPDLVSRLGELRRARLLQEFELGPLARAEIGAMLRAILDLDRPVRAEFLERITSLTEGNTFFIEEVLGAVINAGGVFSGDGRSDHRSLSELRIPPTIQDAVRHRAAQLGPGARDVLALAAVAGRRFEFNVLHALTNHSEETLLDCLKELIAAQLVVEESAECFAFRHALTREAIFRQLLARERKILHQRIGDCLELLRPDELDAHLEDLAYHFFEAGCWPKALEYAARAAQRARALQAPRAAVEHLNRALVAAEHLGDASRLQLLSARGAAQETLGALDRARADYERVLRLASDSQDHPAECQARLDLGFVWTALDYAQAGQHFQAGLELARHTGDARLLARSLNRVGNWHVNVGRPAEAERLHTEALAIFTQLDDRCGMAETLDLLGLATTHGGDAAAGAEYYQRAAELFRVLDDRRALASSLAMLAQLGAMAYRETAGPEYGLAVSVRYAEESLTLAQGIGWRGGEAFALAGLSVALGQAGDLARGLDTARTCLAIAEEVEHQQWIAMAHLVLGGAYLDMSAPTLAQQHLEHCRALAVETGSVIFGQQAVALLALTHLLQGHLTEAQLSLASGLGYDAAYEVSRLLAGAWATGQSRGQRQLWFVWGRMALARGDPATALRIADALGGRDKEALVPEVRLLRGEALLHLGRLVEAETTLHATLQAGELHGVPMLVIRSQAMLTRVLRRQRRFVEAAALVATTEALIEQLAEHVPDIDAPDLAGGSLRANFLTVMRASLPGLRPTTALRAAKQRYAGLTARERQVAVLVARGRSNSEIAEALVVGRRTAQTHVANILRKLGCKTRAQVAAWAAAEGLLDNTNELGADLH